MATVMKNTEFTEKLKDIAQNYKTLYTKGCFGAPLNASNKARYCNGISASRKAKIMAASDDTFGFDCVCLIKGILWGWRGDKTAVYGGASYASNGVPDIGTEEILQACSGVSKDFSVIKVGELVWMPGHVGVYIGEGLAVECTSLWQDKVQITACNCVKAGYNSRNWVKHGKLPYIDYGDYGKRANTSVPSETTREEEKKVNITVAVLKKGAKGETVKAMQALLNIRNNARLDLDGSFGAKTDAAVREYQRSRNLEVDGSCGGKTWTALLTR